MFMDIDWDKLADDVEASRRSSRLGAQAYTEHAINLPICDVCNKPVDSVQRDVNLLTSEYLFTVSCHGQTEQFKIDPLVLLEAKMVSIGRAFVRKGIAEQPTHMLESKR